MKYIKMFEDFGSDMMDEARYILVSHLGEIEEIDFIGGDFGFNHQVEMSDRLRQRIRVFRLLESPNVRDLVGFEEHMREETEGIFWNVNLDWYSGKVAILCEGDSIESLLGEWLRERFSDLHAEKVWPDKFYYREKSGTVANPAVVFWCHENGLFANVSYDAIWGFFRTVLCLEESQIRKILHDWLLQSFGLDLEPKRW